MVERFGRKAILIGGAIGQAVCMLAVSLVGTLTPTSPEGAKSMNTAIAIVFLLFLFIVFYKPSWGATVWVYSSEIFSMQTRAAGVAMASQVSMVRETSVYGSSLIPLRRRKMSRTRYYSTPVPESASASTDNGLRQTSFSRLPQ